MKIKQCWALVGAVAIAASTFGASAQTTSLELRSEPGFVDFDRFGAFDPDGMKLEINLGGALLRLLSSSVEQEDGEFAKLLRGLRAIKVNVYEADTARSQDAAGRIRSVVRDLQKSGWESVMSVRDEGSLNLLVRSNDKLILGLFAAFTDDEGSIGFLNIVGDFDPVQIGRLARQLDLGALDGLDLGALVPSDGDKSAPPPERKP